MQRLTGVVAIAVICFLIAGYIGAAGVWMLVEPRSMATMPGATQLLGLKQGGPYGALLAGMAWALIGWGLLRRHNWARWATILAAVWGIALVSTNAVEFSAHVGRHLLSYVSQVMVRVAVVWYLFRAPVADQFRKLAKSS